jgi:hypothetical protein
VTNELASQLPFGAIQTRPVSEQRASYSATGEPNALQAELHDGENKG